MDAKETAKKITEIRSLLNKHHFPNYWIKKKFEKEADNQLNEIDNNLCELLTNIMIKHKLTIQDL